MKNHIVAPIALPRKRCLKPGSGGLNPDPEAEIAIRFYFGLP
jgi:hypothetical protein